MRTHLRRVHILRHILHSSPISGKVFVFIQLLGIIVLELAVLTIFPALLVVAAVGDLLTFRIPNWVSLALAGLFVVAGALAGIGWEAFGFHLALAAGLLLLGMGLFALNLLGGGDAKLLAAVGLWMGWAAMGPYLAWAAIAGGILAVLLLLFRKMTLPERLTAPPWVARLHSKHEGIPYGIALAAGALMALPQTIWFELVVTPL